MSNEHSSGRRPNYPVGRGDREPGEPAVVKLAGETMWLAVRTANRFGREGRLYEPSAGAIAVMQPDYPHWRSLLAAAQAGKPVTLGQYRVEEDQEQDAFEDQEQDAPEAQEQDAPEEPEELSNWDRQRGIARAQAIVDRSMKKRADAAKDQQDTQDHMAETVRLFGKNKNPPRRMHPQQRQETPK